MVVVVFNGGGFFVFCRRWRGGREKGLKREGGDDE